MKKLILLLFATFLMISGLDAKNKKDKKQSAPKDSIESLVGALKWRSIGPALTSGRIIDFAVHPEKSSTYYVATASGGVWKTTNSGITYKAVFDDQGSYSIGCVSIDPNNPHVVWVGTGENNSQRSVSYGNGVYKSEDDGITWKNMGLKKSEHIAKVVIDPRNSSVVFVAAQGPLWGPGGDRGLYKSTDGGQNWKKVLDISENTGVTDLIYDPRNPDIMFAASYQRRRHVYTLINGGPESAVYKSTDGGVTWKKLANGLPKGELGRIGLAISPLNPDYVFALIEAGENKGGFYRSNDLGASWKKMNPYKTSSAQYYQEIICDPFDVNRIYSLDTWTKVSNDGGKTWKNLGNQSRHVDDHAFWIDPKNPEHYLIGGDGGVYETYDRGKLWDFKENLPVTQFYKVTTDNSIPFYYVYGGTQDNNSIGGPSQTTSINGIGNFDWFITNGGDGFEAAVDPEDPNIVYSQSQYGYLTRLNRASNDKVSIMPAEDQGEDAYRWNWNSPLIISPHSHTRLYFACNYLFKSDDMGNSWTKISPDLTRQLNRNLLPVMGKIQSPEAVAKNASTSQYGNIVALSESPVQEGLLYVGTDDGLIQVSVDDGKNWSKIEKISGVPEMTYVSSIYASNHDKNLVYATFENRKRADFKPYVFKSTDQGKTWTAIGTGLPKNLPVHSIVEDPVKPGLLFIGTEFGVYTSLNNGKKWYKFSGGLPTICVKDIDIQKRENDSVIATFGRGFYVLDDYSPLRKISADLYKKEASVFKIKDALQYIPSKPLGLRNKGTQGENYFNTPNPPYGAQITYFVKESFKSKKNIRKENEKKLLKNNSDIQYPSFEELRAEDQENKAYLYLNIYDSNKLLVRKIKQAYKKGIHRAYWNFRYTSVSPATLRESKPGRYSNADDGFLALPGQYYANLSKVADHVETDLCEMTPFRVYNMENSYTKPEDKQDMFAFMREVSDLRRSAYALNSLMNDYSKRIKLMRVALDNCSSSTEEMYKQIKEIEHLYLAIQLKWNGDKSKAKRNKSIPPTPLGRIQSIMWGAWNTQGPPTKTMMKNYKIAREEFIDLLAQFKVLVNNKISPLEQQMEKAGAPYTPGRIPEYEKD